MQIITNSWSQIISIIVSLVSVLVAVKSYNTNRARIFFLKSMSEEKMLDFGQIKVISKDTDSFNKTLLPFPEGVLKRINILNPSPIDVAYFNLHAVVDDQDVEIYTEKSFGYFKQKYTFQFTRHNGWTGEIILPPAPQGKLKANSNNTFYLFIPFDKMIYQYRHIPKSCVIELSYALKDWKHPLTPYKTKKMTIDSSIWKGWITLKLLTDKLYLLPMLSGQMAIVPIPFFISNVLKTTHYWLIETLKSIQKPSHKDQAEVKIE